MIYNNISGEKVNVVHEFFHFLRSLKVIGIIHTKATRPPGQDGYTLEFAGYDPSFKNRLTPEEKIEAYFRASQQLEACTRQTE